MEYHSDRFTDFSLLIFQGNRLMAVLPANRNDAVVYSHQGLTYGGLVLKQGMGLEHVTQIFESVLVYLKEEKIKKLVIKQLPEIYHKRPSNELYYLLTKHAEIIDTQMVLAVDYSKPLQIHKTKQKYYRKGEKHGFVIKKEDDFELFWTQILVPRLQTRHNAMPVHTVAEMRYLKSMFPDNIFQYNIYYEEELLAGITIFETDQVVKSQYGATTAKGEQLKAFDYLFLHLIFMYQQQKKIFSQGTVTEKNELGYNPGLLKQKEELGCEIFLQHTYALTLSEG